MTDKNPPIQKAENSAPVPLKERRGEILFLIRQLIELSETQLGTGPKELSKEMEEHLVTYDWPGGEKELETAVKRACIMSDGPVLQIEDFDLKQRQVKSIGKFVETRLTGFMRNINRFEKFNLYDMVIPEVEKSLILMVLKETKGNQLKASRLLGINRNTLRSKIRKLKIRAKGL